MDHFITILTVNGLTTLYIFGHPVHSSPALCCYTPVGGKRWATQWLKPRARRLCSHANWLRCGMQNPQRPASLSCGITTEINTRASAEDWLNFRLQLPPTHGRHAAVSVRTAVPLSWVVVVVVVTTISSAHLPANWKHLHNACWQSHLVCGRCTRVCLFPRVGK